MQVDMQWLLIIAGAIVVLGVLAGAWWNWRQNRILRTECPACGNRLRFVAKSAGGRGVCPRCGEVLTFPK